MLWSYVPMIVVTPFSLLSLLFHCFAVHGTVTKKRPDGLGKVGPV